MILKPLPTSNSRASEREETEDEEKRSNRVPYVFDNFYIDMNGILHDCAHGQTLGTIPRNSDDVFENLQNYLDRLLFSVNPQKTLFLSVDGVAPRAKVKEQRGRRFRAGMEEEDIKQIESQLKRDMIAEGFEFPPDVDEPEESFNAMNIFPGTQFMKDLRVFLDYYIAKTLQTHPALHNLNVVVSDSDVPGEGEHKIMEFIRSQRTQPDYSPSQSHIIHGLDADLSMLALSSHEPNFFILVEQLFSARCAICGATDHSTRQCAQLPRKKFGASRKDDRFYHRPLQVIRIATLREYLDLEMRPVVPQMRMRYDLERVIDDYVFLCIFVGNDFLPSLPLLDIREGAVTMLLNIYRRLLPTWNDYIIRPGGEINYMQVQTLMREVYENERNILRRKRLFGKYTVGNLQRPSEKDESAKEMEMGEEDSVTLVNLFIKTMVDSVAKSGNKNVDYVKTIQVFDLRLRQLVKQYFDNVPKNDVDYSQANWADDYYRKKMGIEPMDHVSIERVCQEYMLGLSWIMQYYCKGCVSWDWFYPQHYAPLLRDLSAMNNVTVSFVKGKPISKLEAMIATRTPFTSILPPQLEQLVAAPGSKLAPFYPRNFTVDGNGKRARWMGVARVPLLDFDLLHEEVERVRPTLPNELLEREKSGPTRIFFHRNHCVLKDLSWSGESQQVRTGKHTIAGWLKPTKMSDVSCMDERFPRVVVDNVMCCEYQAPKIDVSRLSCLLPGAMKPSTELGRRGLEIREPRNWMGVTISDLGRGYAWSDYIQMRFYHTVSRNCQLVSMSRRLLRRIH